MPLRRQLRRGGCPIACNVCQQTITLTCDDKTRLYGDANPAWTYSIDDSALRCGDTEDAIRTTGTPAFTTSAGQTTGVGTYPVSLAAGTLCPANYALQFVDGNLTVSPAPLTVTADAKTMVHGSAVPALTGTVSGIKNSDAINFSGSTIATTSKRGGQLRYYRHGGGRLGRAGQLHPHHTQRRAHHHMTLLAFLPRCASTTPRAPIR